MITEFDGEFRPSFIEILHCFREFKELRLCFVIVMQRCYEVIFLNFD